MGSFVLFSFLQISHVPLLWELLQLWQGAAVWLLHGESTEVSPEVILRIFEKTTKG